MSKSTELNENYQLSVAAVKSFGIEEKKLMKRHAELEDKVNQKEASYNDAQSQLAELTSTLTDVSIKRSSSEIEQLQLIYSEKLNEFKSIKEELTSIREAINSLKESYMKNRKKVELFDDKRNQAKRKIRAFHDEKLQQDIYLRAVKGNSNV